MLSILDGMMLSVLYKKYTNRVNKRISIVQLLYEVDLLNYRLYIGVVGRYRYIFTCIAHNTFSFIGCSPVLPKLAARIFMAD